MGQVVREAQFQKADARHRALVLLLEAFGTRAEQEAKLLERQVFIPTQPSNHLPHHRWLDPLSCPDGGCLAPQLFAFG